MVFAAVCKAIVVNRKRRRSGRTRWRAALTGTYPVCFRAAALPTTTSEVRLSKAFDLSYLKSVNTRRLSGGGHEVFEVPFPCFCKP
jgi:hypothetical protein